MRLRHAVKKILPVPLLKDIFLFYNRIRIATIDKILFPEYVIEKDKFLIYRNGFPFREANIEISDLIDTNVKNFMSDWYNWTQEEFLLKLDNSCCVEPDFGWAIVNRNRLLYYSLGVSRTPFQPKPHFLKLLFNTKRERVGQAISLRDTGEENYFHFYNDVLSKLFFLKNQGVDIQSLPVIVSARAWAKEYFQYALKCSVLLSSIKWILQSDQYIYCEKAIFCKPLTHQFDLWDKTRQLFGNISKSNSRRVFLTRSKNRLRFIENSSEIESVCSKFGFEIIDTDELTLQQQIAIFSNVEFLIGIHGAGLTNMIFMQGKCRVLELFPPPSLGYLPYHYIMLSKMNGFEYNAIIGEEGKTKYSGGFYLSGEDLEHTIKQLL
jgi:hypothetical protein